MTRLACGPLTRRPQYTPRIVFYARTLIPRQCSASGRSLHRGLPSGGALCAARLAHAHAKREESVLEDAEEGYCTLLDDDGWEDVLTSNSGATREERKTLGWWLMMILA